jgi:hypothetical protein
MPGYKEPNKPKIESGAERKQTSRFRELVGDTVLRNGILKTYENMENTDALLSAVDAIERGQVDVYMKYAMGRIDSSEFDSMERRENERAKVVEAMQILVALHDELEDSEHKPDEAFIHDMIARLEVLS